MSDRIVDVLMWVGVEHYPTLLSYVRESMAQGVSKRIPRSMIPNITPGESRLFLVYPTAFVHIKFSDYLDLLNTLDPVNFVAFEEEELQELSEPPAYDPEEPAVSTTPLPKGLYRIKILLETLECSNPEHYAKVVEDFGITYHPAVIGYTYLTGINYIASEDEEDLPEDLAHLDGLIEPVRIEVKE